MRIFKLVISLWWDENWLGSFSRSWRKRGYLWRYYRPQPWVEQVQAGPLRLDVAVSWTMRGENTTNG